MTRRVVFRRAARAEFETAAIRYDLQKPWLGRDFVSEIERAIDTAANAPERFPITVRDSRRAHVRRFRILSSIVSSHADSRSRYAPGTPQRVAISR